MYEWAIEKVQPQNFLYQLISAFPSDDRLFHIHGSFGDVYLQIAVVRELINEGVNVGVVIDPKYQILAKNALEGKARFVFLDGNLVNHQLNKLSLLGNYGRYPIRLLPTLYPMIPECIAEGALSQSDFIRIIAGSNSIGSFPKLENSEELQNQAKELLKISGAPIGRCVLISADNNTQPEFPEKLWHSICDFIVSKGWMPLINDSGNLTSTSSKLLSSFDWPKVKVPPHLAVSVTVAAGSYIVGSNGFGSTQALFNDGVTGVHIVNSIGQTGRYLHHKDGSRILASHCLNSNAFLTSFLGIQKELIVSDDNLNNELKGTLDDLLS